MKIRNRIVETATVLGRDLAPNPRNWREHPKAQEAALKAILQEIGIVAPVTAVRLPDNQLMLLDGHLRAAIMSDQALTVSVVNMTDAERDKMLAAFDPVGAMATADSQRLNELLETVRSDDPALIALLDGLRAS